LETWQVSYIFSLLMVCFMWWIFYKSKDGLLRVAMLILFAGYATAMILRVALVLFSIDLNTVNQMVIFPTLVAQMVACIVAGSYYINNKERK